MLQVKQGLLASGLRHQMGKTAHWNPRDGGQGQALVRIPGMGSPAPQKPTAYPLDRCPKLPPACS